MSEAIELYKRDGTTAGIFYCSECRVVFKTQEEAHNCHGERVCACGNKIEQRYRPVCNACDSRDWKERDAAKEAERFEKANKIPESEYKGEMVYGLDDQYYEEIESAIDSYLEGQEPEYVWACKDVGVVKATTENLYENMLENMWEDASVDDLYGVDELEKAVEVFNKENEGIHVWTPDYTTAILVQRREKISA